MAILVTPVWARCCSNVSTFAPPAASPTTSKRSGLAAMTSSAWVPIEPVLPSTSTRRRPSAGAGAVGLVTYSLCLLRDDSGQAAGDAAARYGAGVEASTHPRRERRRIGIAAPTTGDGTSRATCCLRVRLWSATTQRAGTSDKGVE